MQNISPDLSGIQVFDEAHVRVDRGPPKLGIRLFGVEHANPYYQLREVNVFAFLHLLIVLNDFQSITFIFK
jgi:hypothetical protein